MDRKNERRGEGLRSPGFSPSKASDTCAWVNSSAEMFRQEEFCQVH